MKRTTYICLTGMGIALYVVLSMVAKIPVIAHISLDLGYIVLAVYCYHLGPVVGMIVGGAGCVLVSLLTTGWFPPGWMLGNIVIALMCGYLYIPSGTKTATILNIVSTVIAVIFGILVIKTVVESQLYGIPFAVKLSRNAVAFVMDAIVMSVGVVFAQYGPIVKMYYKVIGKEDA